MFCQSEGIVKRGERSNDKSKETYYSFCPCYCLYVKVYTLSDKYGNVFYVGCTAQTLEKRLKEHLSLHTLAGSYNLKKVAIIKKLNSEIFITAIETHYVTANSSDDAHRMLKQRELYWINKYIELGHELSNVSGI